MISHAITDGLMVAGDVDHDRFQPWHLSAGETVARIVRDWRNLNGVDPYPGDVCWLANTERGDGLGREVLERERHLS